jgi:hypothetical protein
MPKKSQPEQTNGAPTWDSLLDMAIELAKSASNLSQALTACNAASRVDYGNTLNKATPEPIDHAMRSRLNHTITALHDFRLSMRHALLIGVHDEDEKTKIIMGDYC